MFDDRPEPAKRLEAARINRGFSTAKEASEAFGWNLFTYTQHENGTRGIVRAADRYARAYGVSEGWLLTGEGVGLDKVAIENVSPDSPLKPAKVAATNTSLVIIGTVAAGLWREEDMVTEPLNPPVPPIPGYPENAQRVYRVEGTSLNKKVADGGIIITLDVMASGVEIRHNDLVVVRRSRHGMSEYTVKRYVVEGGQPALRPESDDPRWQEAIPLEGDDDTEIEIIDVVLAEFKALRQL